MTAALLVIGGCLFGILGLLHAVYTFADARNPRRLAPQDPAVLRSMSSTSVRISGGATTMWRAWLGFNFSHSLGALMFSAACIAAALALPGLALPGLALPKAALLLPVAIGVVYLWLAIHYWFRIPAIGIALGTLCFAAAWLAY
jgi:hypothetical protein